MLARRNAAHDTAGAAIQPTWHGAPGCTARSALAQGGPTAQSLPCHPQFTSSSPSPPSASGVPSALPAATAPNPPKPVPPKVADAPKMGVGEAACGAGRQGLAAWWATAGGATGGGSAAPSAARPRYGAGPAIQGWVAACSGAAGGRLQARQAGLKVMRACPGVPRPPAASAGAIGRPGRTLGSSATSLGCSASALMAFVWWGAPGVAARVLVGAANRGERQGCSGALASPAPTGGPSSPQVDRPPCTMGSQSGGVFSPPTARKQWSLRSFEVSVRLATTFSTSPRHTADRRAARSPPGTAR